MCRNCFLHDAVIHDVVTYKICLKKLHNLIELYPKRKQDKIEFMLEKIGGRIHMALGDSHSESRGLNKSTVHWGVSKGMRKNGEVYADGKLFHKNGNFMI